MKIVILRGGAAGADTRTDPANRGITALGTDDGHWVLVNVSASVAQQLSRGSLAQAHPELYNATVRAVVLTDGQLEHVGGLLGLRNGNAIELYATPAVFEDLTTTLPVLPVLQHYCGVHWHVVPVAGDTRVASFRVEGMPRWNSPRWPRRCRRRRIRRTTSSRWWATASHWPCATWSPASACSARPASRASAPSSSTGCNRPTACWWTACPPRKAAIAPTTTPAWVDMLSGLPARHKVLFADEALQTREQLAQRGIALAYDGLEIDL